MSTQIALDNIHLRSCPRWAHTEYSLGYHRPYLAQRAKVDENDPALEAKAYDLLDMDFIWSINEGPVPWSKRGRVTDMGHASYAADGSDQREPATSPFRDDTEVWAFDAVGEYGLPEFDELVAHYEQVLANARQAFPHQLTTGGYYHTIVSGAIQAFGWDMLLLAAADEDKMERVFDSFYRLTQHHMNAWAGTSAEVLIQHDDFVWTAGPFMRPEYYRRVFIPRYAALWKPLKQAGKKVLFCSDGDFRQFAGDILEAGADGLIFEPVNDFQWMTERFGDAACLVGSAVDCRDLTFENWDEVQRNLDQTVKQLQSCRGAIVAVGNHLPPNISGHMLDRYFDYLLPRLGR